MPWKETHVMDERLKFVAQYLDGTWRMTELCRAFAGQTHARPVRTQHNLDSAVIITVLVPWHRAPPLPSPRAGP